MRPILAICFFLILAASCKDAGRTPDVSGINIKFEVQRFEQDLFALDTINMAASIQALQQKYPQFLVDFMANILGVPPGDPQAGLVLKKFITDFRPIKETADKTIPDISSYSKEVEQMLKYVKFYFPQYQLPEKMITFIGPMDAFYEASLGWSGDIITTSGLGVGLQMHLGRESPFYMQDGGQGYPEYISRRFEPAYIPVNCAKNVIDDIYPDKSRSKALVDQMVDKGKRLYVLDRLFPNTPDTLKIGYTAAQLTGCIKNEGLIWNTFASNNLLFETDFQKIKTFVGEGPKTIELGENSPGYIALFVGRQIVEAYMDKFPETSLQQLLDTDNRKVYELSKYKPK